MSRIAAFTCLWACTVISQMISTANAQSVSTRTELEERVKQLTFENAQLRLELENIKRKLNELQPGVETPPAMVEPAQENSVTFVIETIRDMTDNGARHMRIGEIKKQLPAAQKRVDDAQQRIEEMKEKNSYDKKLWDNHRRPYNGPRKPGARWEKPHPDEVIGQENLKKMKAENVVRRLTAELRKLERSPTEVQMLITGRIERAEGEPGPTLIHVNCEGTLAKQVQRKKPGDRITLTGDVMEGDEEFISVQGRSMRDARDSKEAMKTVPAEANPEVKSQEDVDK